jgi:hypothetical protein
MSEDISPPRQHTGRLSRAMLVVVCLCLAAVAWFPLRWTYAYIQVWRMTRGHEITSHDEFSWALKNLLTALGANSVGGVKVYSLGGFIDEEFVWTFHGSQKQLTEICKRFDLQPVKSASEVPAEFWSMPPEWWTPTNSKLVAFFGSKFFDPHQRGMDGQHYLMMHDTSSNSFFFWHKDNF